MRTNKQTVASSNTSHETLYKSRNVPCINQDVTHSVLDIDWYVQFNILSHSRTLLSSLLFFQYYLEISISSAIIPQGNPYKYWVKIEIE